MQATGGIANVLSSGEPADHEKTAMSAQREALTKWL